MNHVGGALPLKIKSIRLPKVAHILMMVDHQGKILKDCPMRSCCLLVGLFQVASSFDAAKDIMERSEQGTPRITNLRLVAGQESTKMESVIREKPPNESISNHDVIIAAFKELHMSVKGSSTIMKRSGFCRVVNALLIVAMVIQPPLIAEVHNFLKRSHLGLLGGLVSLNIDACGNVDFVRNKQDFECDLTDPESTNTFQSSPLRINRQTQTLKNILQSNLEDRGVLIIPQFDRIGADILSMETWKQFPPPHIGL
ncbi:hypothetical protein HPP92_000364 [Vanilla planifolia]|uniref:Uncharacterized protein n=1 Tax=Vanilla planifolia TaxID=51239 RepID=A0A835SA07_VANPL|nr:hypothetical protein HPP92_000364 [Vanilla planifolia]